LAEKLLKRFFTVCVDFAVIWLMTSIYALVGGIKRACDAEAIYSVCLFDCNFHLHI
jgi:hypothetical protein